MSMEIYSTIARNSFTPLNVTPKNPFSRFTIFCSDTDVLLILFYYFQDTYSSTVFKTRDKDIHLRALYEVLNKIFAKLYIGFTPLPGKTRKEDFMDT